MKLMRTALPVVLLAALAACGSGGQTDKSGAEPSVSASTAAPTTAPSAAKKPSSLATPTPAPRVVSKAQPDNPACRMVPLKDMEALLAGHGVDKYDTEANGLSWNCYFIANADKAGEPNYVGVSSIDCYAKGKADQLWSQTGAKRPVLDGAPGARGGNADAWVMVPTSLAGKCIATLHAARPNIGVVVAAINHSYPKIKKFAATQP